MADLLAATDTSPAPITASLKTLEASAAWTAVLARGIARVQPWLLYAFCFGITFSNAVVETASTLLIVCWLLQRVWLERRPLHHTRPTRTVRWALFAYLAICALSIITSSHPDLSIKGFVGKTLQYGLIMLAVADVARRPGVARRAIWALIASTVVAVVDTGVQYATGRELLFGYGFPFIDFGGRLTGPFRNPIDLATCLVVLLPLVAVRMGTGAWWRRALLVILGLGLLGIVVNATTRSGWLSLFAATAVLAWARPLRRQVIPIVAIAFLIGLMVFAAEGRLRGAITLTDVGSQDRIYMWRSAIWMIKERPLLGHGVNTFMANYLSHWVGGEQQPRYAHNCYLQVAAETGVFGLAAFVWLLGSLWLVGWRTLARLTVVEDQRLLLACLAGVTAFLMQALMDTSFYGVRLAALFWCLAGFVLGYASPDTHDTPIHTPS